MFVQQRIESGGGGEASSPAWMRLHGVMKSATRRRCAWDAEHARHLREAEALQLWSHFGYVSILEYLEREHGIEPRTALDRLRVANALAELPMLEAELEEGTFGYSHVKELTRVVTPKTEDCAAASGRVRVAVAEDHVEGRGQPRDGDVRNVGFSDGPTGMSGHSCRGLAVRAVGSGPLCAPGGIRERQLP